jgi:hypothetical protein
MRWSKKPEAFCVAASAAQALSLFEVSRQKAISSRGRSRTSSLQKSLLRLVCEQISLSLVARGIMQRYEAFRPSAPRDGAGLSRR